MSEARDGHDCVTLGQFDDDGYCLSCGLRQSGQGVIPPGDRVETDLGAMAGMSDRGLIHHANEDAMGLAVVPLPDPSDVGPDAGGAGESGGADSGRTAMVAVVCDGVSTVPGSAHAAQAAAVTATAELTSWLGSPGTGGADVASALRVAAIRAQGAVTSLAAPGTGEDGDTDAEPGMATGLAPSCTFAAAVAAEGTLHVAWLGDSRVYLFGPATAERLTADDTVAAEAARVGLIPPEEAETGRGAHMITRWLGPDSPAGGGAHPHIVSTTLTGPGRVVVCTDGLWNYMSAAATLAARVAELPSGAPAIEVARHLTDVALRAGGRDNITVVVMDIPGST